MRLNIKNTDHSRRKIDFNCVMYTGQWWFMQSYFSWNFRKVMKTQYRDVVLCPYEDSGLLDYLMASNI